MKVGVLGSGIVGQTPAAGFLTHGHQVLIGTRDPKAKDFLKWAGKNHGAKTGTFADAAQFGKVLVLAVLARVVEDVIKLAGSHNFRDKVLIDTNNPIADAPPSDGVPQFFTEQNHSLAERLQQLLPETKVVKAFNSVGAARMVNPHFEEGTPTMFLCGNDAEAKAKVSEVIRQFAWEPFDCGGIVAARAVEPLCILWCIPGFRSNSWTHAFKLVTN